jgi:hypothetical protein
MKLLNLISLFFLLNINSSAQLNYFSKIFNLGCASSGLKIIKNENNFDLIAGALCLGPGSKIVFVRLDSTGNILFTKTHGDNFHNYVPGYGDLILLDDSSYVFAGAINDSLNIGDVILYKLTQDGDSIWIKQYGGDTLFQSGFECKQTRDKGFVIAGATHTYDPQEDVLLLKVDSNGNKKWERHFGGLNRDLAVSIDTTIDGGYIIFGSTASFGTGTNTNSLFPNCYVIKTDSLGVEQWSRTFGDVYDDEIWNGFTCHDGSFVFAGFYTYYDPYFPTLCCTDDYNKLCIVKIDTAGNTIFEKQYGREGSLNWLYSIKELPNGDLISTGWYRDTLVVHVRGVILRTNSMGDSLWMHTYEHLHGPYSGSYLYDVAPTNDGGFIATGFSLPLSPDTGQQAVWILKVDSNGCEISNCIVNTINEFTYGNEAIRIFPNPSSGFFNIEINTEINRGRFEVYNSTGQCILFSDKIPVSFDIGRFSDGIYFYKITDDKFKEYRGKLIKFSN